MGTPAKIRFNRNSILAVTDLAICPAKSVMKLKKRYVVQEFPNPSGEIIKLKLEDVNLETVMRHLAREFQSAWMAR